MADDHLTICLAAEVLAEAEDPPPFQQFPTEYNAPSCRASPMFVECNSSGIRTRHMADSQGLTRRETQIAGTALTAVASPITPSAAQGGVSTLPPEDTGVALQVNGKAHEATNSICNSPDPPRHDSSASGNGIVATSVLWNG